MCFFYTLHTRQPTPSPTSRIVTLQSALVQIKEWVNTVVPLLTDLGLKDPSPDPKGPSATGNEKEPVTQTKTNKTIEDTNTKEKGQKEGASEEEEEALIWTWAESCESWRWKNYEIGLHDIKDGGWEERDWKVFADGKGVGEFEEEEEEAEVLEIDVHDWSC